MPYKESNHPKMPYHYNKVFNHPKTSHHYDKASYHPHMPYHYYKVSYHRYNIRFRCPIIVISSSYHRHIIGISIADSVAKEINICAEGKQKFSRSKTYVWLVSLF